MSKSDPILRVSFLFRLLAGMLTLGCLLTIVDLGLDWFRFKEWRLRPEESLLLVPAILLCTFLFGYVAFTGRQPQFMTSLELYHEKLQLPPGRVVKLTRTFSFRLAAAVGILCILIVADLNGFFGDDIRGFVFVVESLSIFAAAILIWSKYRSNSKAKKEQMR